MHEARGDSYGPRSGSGRSAEGWGSAAMGWEDDVAMDGWTAEKVFGGCPTGYGYDDITFLPGHVSFEASDVDLGGKLTNRISLRMPLLSSPVGTVTESEMAIKMALLGSMGVIHGNQSAEAQAAMIQRVKRFVNGFILEPFVLGPKNTVEDLDKLKAEHGVGGVPITEDGKLHGKLIGWVGARDTDTIPEEDRKRQLQHIMVKKVVMGQEPISLKEATDLLRKAKVGKLPIVDAENRLVSLVCRSDVKKSREYPNMSVNDSNQLMVGAAVLVGLEDDYERAKGLVGVGADVLFLDGSVDAGDRLLDLIKRLKAENPETDIIAGPACSCRQAKRLAELGVDAILIGSSVPPGGFDFGSASSAVGRPEATAMFEVGTYIRLNFGIPAIAGPGIFCVGHALKAICLGASAVLLSEPLAGTDEAPGAQVLRDGTWMKLQHSEEPLRALRSRLSAKHMPDSIPRHISRAVPCQGSVTGLVPYMLQGIRAGMQDLGLKSLPELHKALDGGDLRLECRSPLSAQLMAAAAQIARQSPKPEVMPFFVAAQQYGA
mmetsp:Transcript_76795/g.248863  ORF Transcript_76795/g.248863 Transcript_76795/m.248863 type:complete len:546 (+) Transcript_76795:32-1669(+)